MALREFIIGALFFTIIVLGLNGWVTSVQQKTGLGLEPIRNETGGDVFASTEKYAKDTQAALQTPSITGIKEIDTPLGFLSGAYSVLIGSMGYLFGLPTALSNTLQTSLSIPPIFAGIFVLILVVIILYEILSILLGRTM